MLVFINKHPKDQFPVKSYGFLALISKYYRYDQEIIAYANEKIKQFWRNPVLHDIRYKYDAKYRLNSEIKAFAAYLDKVDPKYYPTQVMSASKYLAGICNIDKQEAIRILAKL